MFKWVKKVFGTPTDDDDEDVIEVVSPKKPYTGTIDDELDSNNELENDEMPIIPEQSTADAVDNMNLMVEDPITGQQVPANPHQMQAMMYRPDNYEGLPGISRKTRRRQPNQQRPQGNQMQQTLHQQQIPPQQQQYDQFGNQTIAQRQYYDQFGNPVNPQGNVNQMQQQPSQQMSQQPMMPTQPPQAQPQPEQTQQPQKLYPCFEMYTLDSAYYLHVDLPGIDVDSLDIEFDNEILSIYGARSHSMDKQKHANGRAKNIDDVADFECTIPDHLLREFNFDFPFTKSIAEDQIKIDYTDGVLTVILPHRQKGNKIKLGIGGKKKRKAPTKRSAPRQQKQSVDDVPDVLESDNDPA